MKPKKPKVTSKCRIEYQKLFFDCEEHFKAWKQLPWYKRLFCDQTKVNYERDS